MQTNRQGHWKENSIWVWKKKALHSSDFQTRAGCAASSQAEEMTVTRLGDTKSMYFHMHFHIWGKLTAVINGTQNLTMTTWWVCKEGPEHPLGFTVNTQRKHCTRAFTQLLLRNYPQLATRLLHQDRLRWPFYKILSTCINSCSDSLRPSANTLGWTKHAKRISNLPPAHQYSI